MILRTGRNEGRAGVRERGARREGGRWGGSDVMAIK